MIISSRQIKSDIMDQLAPKPPERANRVGFIEFIFASNFEGMHSLVEMESDYADRDVHLKVDLALKASGFGFGVETGVWQIEFSAANEAEIETAIHGIVDKLRENLVKNRLGSIFHDEYPNDDYVIVFNILQ